MRQTLNRGMLLASMCAVLIAGTARADALITDFNNFVSDALFPSWAFPASTVVSGPNSYSITATGYGSNYKYIGGSPIAGGGNTTLELTVNLSGPPAADGHLGPIVGLIDGDGTHHNYAWYGQTLGSHVLTMPVGLPTWVAAPGADPSFDLNSLTHMHIQLDPGGFGSSGQYTVEWQNLRLVPEPSSLLLLTSCGGLVLGFRRRKANRA